MDVNLVELIGAALGGGTVTGVVDRWMYRRRPALDVAALAQQVASQTMEHAREEIQRTWDASERYRQAAEAEMRRLESEVAVLRARLEQSEQRSEREINELRTKLAAAEAAATAKDREIERLRSLTVHAQSQLGSAPIH